MKIARGLLSEDDYLVTEILFNPNTPAQLKLIQKNMAELAAIVDKKDSEAMLRFLARARENIK
jgi:prephenate dehydrogenase